MKKFFTLTNLICCLCAIICSYGAADSYAAGDITFTAINGFFAILYSICGIYRNFKNNTWKF